MNVLQKIKEAVAKVAGARSALADLEHASSDDGKVPDEALLGWPVLNGHIEQHVVARIEALDSYGKVQDFFFGRDSVENSTTSKVKVAYTVRIFATKSTTVEDCSMKLFTDFRAAYIYAETAYIQATAQAALDGVERLEHYLAKRAEKQLATQAEAAV